MSDNPATPPPAALPPVPDARGAGDVTSEVDRWCEAFRGPGVEAIHRMATEYLAQREDAHRLREQNAALVAERDALRAAVEKIASFPGTTLGLPTAKDVASPENRAFQRGLDMAFYRCAEVARAALPSAAPPERRGDGGRA